MIDMMMKRTTHHQLHSENKTSRHPNIDLQANATAAQLELTIQMTSNLSTSSPAISQFRETLPVLLDSLQTTQSLLSEYTSMAQSRDSWYARQLKKERARQDVWEESLKVVVKEGEGLENELRKRSRNRGSRVFGAGGSPAGTIIGGIGEGKKKRPSTLGFVTSLVTEESPSPISHREEPPVSAITGPPITPQQQQEFRVPSRRGTIVAPIQANNTAVDGDQDNFDHDTDEEDEFFDAIENNALPNML